MLWTCHWWNSGPDPYGFPVGLQTWKRNPPQQSWRLPLLIDPGATSTQSTYQSTWGSLYSLAEFYIKGQECPSSLGPLARQHGTAHRPSGWHKILIKVSSHHKIPWPPNLSRLLTGIAQNPTSKPLEGCSDWERNSLQPAIFRLTNTAKTFQALPDRKCPKSYEQTTRGLFKLQKKLPTTADIVTSKHCKNFSCFTRPKMHFGTFQNFKHDNIAKFPPTFFTGFPTNSFVGTKVRQVLRSLD